jgi:hypothetical protein
VATVSRVQIQVKDGDVRDNFKFPLTGLGDQMLRGFAMFKLFPLSESR